MFTGGRRVYPVQMLTGLVLVNRHHRGLLDHLAIGLAGFCGRLYWGIVLLWAWRAPDTLKLLRSSPLVIAFAQTGSGVGLYWA